MVRDATEADLDRLAEIWHQGWHEAHAHLVPMELTRLRPLANFRERLQQALPDVRVIGPFGAPVGFCQLKNDELFQLYVSAKSRGSGVAAALIADGESRLAQHGVEVAWLACAIGNERAARFYEKSGWDRAGIMINEAETSAGSFPLEVWRYEKRLRPPV
ncbi:MAG TPA: GNAT family N-acetyltransferase [Gemmatimonadales bacterium]|nr:GNAT family N-acetyltransferase [Gemmatimonadales bacterium]